MMYLNAYNINIWQTLIMYIVIWPSLSGCSDGCNAIENPEINVTYSETTNGVDLLIKLGYSDSTLTGSRLSKSGTDTLHYRSFRMIVDSATVDSIYKLANTSECGIYRGADGERVVEVTIGRGTSDFVNRDRPLPDGLLEYLWDVAPEDFRDVWNQAVRPRNRIYRSDWHSIKICIGDCVRDGKVYGDSIVIDSDSIRCYGHFRYEEEEAYIVSPYEQTSRALAEWERVSISELVEHINPLTEFYNPAYPLTDIRAISIELDGRRIATGYSCFPAKEEEWYTRFFEGILKIAGYERDPYSAWS